jgi:hypothetical protein
VMYARRPPSSAAMRSRWTPTTSTGETALVAIIRASSVIDAQTRSATSDHPVVRGGFAISELEGVEGPEETERGLDLGPNLLQLGVAPREAGESGARAERLEIDAVTGHGGQDNGCAGGEQVARAGRIVLASLGA